MAIVQVTPLPDGVDQRSNWQVVKDGRRVSTHTKKSAAKRKARRIAGATDEVVISGTGGRFL